MDQYEKLGYAPIHPGVQVALTIIGIIVMVALLAYGFGEYGSIIANVVVQ